MFEAVTRPTTVSPRVYVNINESFALCFCLASASAKRFPTVSAGPAGWKMCLLRAQALAHTLWGDGAEESPKRSRSSAVG